MSLSHVTPGEPATNYQWRGVWSVSGGGSAGLGVRAVAEEVVTWGVAWPDEGIRVSADASDPLVGSPGGEIRFESPWFADQVVTLLSFTGGDWRIEIDQLVLTREGCTSYEWSYDEVRLYVNDTLIYAGGANAGGGTGYDHRHNRLRMQAFCEYDPDLTCNPEACPLPAASVLPRSELLGGYRRDRGSGWESDAILIDSTGYITPLAIVGCPPCSCLPSPPVMTGTDSWEARLIGERRLARLADSRSTDCRCLDGSSGGTVTEHQIDEDYKNDTSYLHVAGIDHGIRLRRIWQRSCCNCVCPPFTDEHCRIASTDAVSTHTYCESERSSAGWINRVFCWEGTVVCPDPPGPDPRCGSDALDEFCAFDCVVRVYWPEDSCAECDEPSLDVSRAWGHVRAAVCGGTIWFDWAPHSAPGAFTSRDTGIVADAVCVRFEHSVGGQRISLSYVVGEELRYRYSEDAGQSWESPVTIQTGVHDATHEIGRDGRRIFLYTVGSGPYDLLAQVWSAQDDVLIAETLVDTGVDPTGLDSREYPSSDGGWLLGLTYRKGGALIYKTSPDGVTFS